VAHTIYVERICVFIAAAKWAHACARACTREHIIDSLAISHERGVRAHGVSITNCVRDLCATLGVVKFWARIDFCC